nr:MAG TPA: hypothetical protein [Caudoviricetes sp.]
MLNYVVTMRIRFARYPDYNGYMVVRYNLSSYDMILYNIR